MSRTFALLMDRGFPALANSHPQVENIFRKKAALVSGSFVRITVLMAVSLFGQLPLIFSQGLVLNEVSNGPSGSKEYFELVVDGTPCTTVDIRGWILDDNNGDFACGPTSGVGIAQGHVRFALVANWSAVPVGSIIVIHNDADLNALVPANDPTDADMDSVYIVPLSSTLLERTTGGVVCPPDPGDQLPMGCTATCPATGSGAYAPVTYAAGGTITPISLANGGDAAQVRDPLGNYVHGISYGGVLLTGGPEGLKISALSGTAKNYIFSDGSPHLLANWAEGAAPANETPGLPNNALNDAYVTALLGHCVLAVKYAEPLTAKVAGEQVNLTWTTLSEENNRGFTILRYAEGDAGYSEIGTVVAGGNGALPFSYTFTDARPLQGTAFYRLRQQDMDGSVHYSNVAEVLSGIDPVKGVVVYPNPADGLVTFQCAAWGDLQLRIVNLTGQVVMEKTVSDLQGQGAFSVDLGACRSGLYYYSLSGNGSAYSGIISLK